MICTIRIPDVLQHRIDKAAGDDGRSKWILEACRMRLDGTCEHGIKPNLEGACRSCHPWIFMERGSSVIEQRPGAEDAGQTPAPESTTLEDRKAIAMQAMSNALMREPSPLRIIGVDEAIESLQGPEPCSYREYDQDTGETYGCRLPVHSAKIKHQRGDAL